MKKKLLIIESPNKIKTLSKYIDNDFEILATVGHIRDLSKFGLGFDMESFEPKWVNIKDKKEIIEEIKEKASKSKEVYIATDPDREGEAIAWHIFKVIPKEFQNICYRVTFNEISKKAVLESFEKKREINEKWVQSQFSRRIIDRLIGFKLSQLLQNKLKAESAGRVQSVALKFIADREKEINSFIPVEWFNIDITLKKDVSISLKQLNPKYKFESNKEIKKSNFNFFKKEEASTVFDELDNKFIVESIGDPVYHKSSSKAPYKTSTMQQDAINKLNMSSKQTTSISQRLYEGIDIDGTQIALISYPRTDSVRLSDSFVKESLSFIEKKYGKDYLGSQKIVKSSANVQDAHEAIRPVDVNLTPESIKSKINKREWDLYNLVWIRAVASLMADAKFKRVKISFSNNKNIFEVSSNICEFEGFRLIYSSSNKNDDELKINLNDFELKSEHNSVTKEITEHETSPPPRYNQASLIAALEKAGVGRPSTYNTMANIVVDRGYSTLESKAFNITEMGKIVIQNLDEYFPTEINPVFTKRMEERLDDIASGKEEWKEWLKEFAPSFNTKVQDAWEKIEKVKDEEVGRECPECKHPLVYKKAKRGGSVFIGCSNWPACTHLEPLEKPKILDIKCPSCKENNVIIRKNKKGSEFIACTGFPKCRYLLSMKDYNDHIAKNDNTPLPIITKEDRAKKAKAAKKTKATKKTKKAK